MAKREPWRAPGKDVDATIGVLYPSYSCVLFPSGRAGINSILELEGVRRPDHVRVAEFSSNCVYHSVSLLGTPTLHCNDKLKAVLLSHQWGFVNRMRESPRDSVLIEDSCDSLVTDERGLFPAGGAYEVFSLPKILGSTFGGLVVCRDKKSADQLRRIRASRSIQLARRQETAKLRALSLGTAEALLAWEGPEPINGHLSAAALRDIQGKLRRFSRISETRRSRLEAIGERGILSYQPADWMYRLPTVWPVNIGSVNTVGLKRRGIETFSRQFNRSRMMDDADFVTSFPVPLHVGVPDPIFLDLVAHIDS